MGSFAGVLLVGLIYFFPTYVAFMRDMVNTRLVFFINLFFGWTIIVWVIALIWAIFGSKN